MKSVLSALLGALAGALVVLAFLPGRLKPGPDGPTWSATLTEHQRLRDRVEYLERRMKDLTGPAEGGDAGEADGGEPVEGEAPPGEDGAAELPGEALWRQVAPYVDALIQYRVAESEQRLLGPVEEPPVMDEPTLFSESLGTDPEATDRVLDIRARAAEARRILWSRREAGDLADDRAFMDALQELRLVELNELGTILGDDQLEVYRQLVPGDRIEGVPTIDIAVPEAVQAGVPAEQDVPPPQPVPQRPPIGMEVLRLTQPIGP